MPAWIGMNGDNGLAMQLQVPTPIFTDTSSLTQWGPALEYRRLP